MAQNLLYAFNRRAIVSHQTVLDGNDDLARYRKVVIEQEVVHLCDAPLNRVLDRNHRMCHLVVLYRLEDGLEIWERKSLDRSSEVLEARILGIGPLLPLKSDQRLFAQVYRAEYLNRCISTLPMLALKGLVVHKCPVSGQTGLLTWSD